jgi:predicted nucleic acid-binding protein
MGDTLNSRVFLDANVLFSAAYKEDSSLLAFWKADKFSLVSSEYAVIEARRNLAMGKAGCADKT